jgi:hypothetical protein
MAALFPLFLFLAAVLLAQSAWSLRDGYRFLAYLGRSLLAAPGGYHPAAAVIVPVRGADAGLASNVEALLAQDYPDYQLIFSVARETDAAYGYLQQSGALLRRDTRERPRDVQVVLAGVTAERGEKVNNLLEALRAVAPRVDVLVFADADARPRSNWLRALIDPLGDPAVTVSTGFRWYLPGSSLASRLRAAWDASIATLLGEHRRNFAWGGSMAMRVEDFRRLKVAERYWARTVSDDYGVTRAVRDAGGWIRFEPKCLVPSAGDVTPGGFFRWANRQIIVTRVYARHLWVWGLASHALFCGTIALGLAVALRAPRVDMRLLSAGSVVCILLLGLGKARLRSRVARLAFPEEPALSLGASCYWRWWPLVPWVMLLNFLIAGLTRTIEWSGTEYELQSPDGVRVIHRND